MPLWPIVPEPYSFDPDADLFWPILQTLNSSHPAATIADQWPWMRGNEANEAVANFVATAIPLKNAMSAELDTLVERFAAVIAVYWREDAEQARRPWWRRR